MTAACRLQPAVQMRRLLFPTLVTLLVTLSALADSGIWGQRGFTRRFVSSGNLLYTADGRGVSVFDVGNPAAIARLDVEWSDDETFDLALMGSATGSEGSSDLVVATSKGVERFAVAPNGTLDRLGSVASSTPVSHIAANGNFAAAASGKRVTLYERDARGGLASVRAYTFPNDVKAIAFGGAFLYVSADRLPLHIFAPPAAAPVALLAGADAVAMSIAAGVLWTASENDGLTAIDISDPSRPRVLGSAGRNELRLRGVAAVGSRVYAFEYPDRVHLFDATSPGEPRLVRTLDEWVNAIGANGTRLFLAGAVIDEEETFFYPALNPRETGKPVRVFDAANLGAPVLAGEFQDFAGPVSGVWTDGSVAYVVDPPYLRVLDVSRTSAPRELTRLLIPNIQDSIRVKNGLAVLYGRAFVNFVDVSAPLRPQHVGTWDARGHPPSAAAVLQSRVIEANDHSGMHILDITDPARAVQIGGRIWHYLDIAASDDAVYALERDNMLVVEIENERTVADRDHIYLQYEQVDTLPPNASRPEFLLIRGAEGLRLYSLEDRFHPAEIDFLPMIGLGVFATGDRAAYIAKDGRLHFATVQTSIALEETEYRVLSPMQMSMAGKKVVVADRYSVRIYGPDTAPPPPEPARRRSVRP